MAEDETVSPVRDRGHYKRPYRLQSELNGRAVNKAFHWPGRWRDELDWLRKAPKARNIKAWVIRDDDGRALDFVVMGS